MIVGVISDIHSNMEALRNVLEKLGEVEKIWCLGDIVGYGPEPARCIDMVSSPWFECIVGNHDLCVLQEIDLGSFNLDALRACLINKNKLDEKHLSFLRSLPRTTEPFPGIALVHGSPRDDVWEYVISSWQADEILSKTKSVITFVGHSHIPLIFMKPGSAAARIAPLFEEVTIDLSRENTKYLINPGSVGQPRDGDPRASYMVLNTREFTLTYHRVEYPVETTQEKMRQEGLPQSLINRLAYGV